MKRCEYRGPEWQFPFVEYAPEEGGGLLPLILQLHGAGERGCGQEDLSVVEVHGFSALLQERDYPCRLILPQCPLGTTWAARVESLYAFLQQLQAHFSVDEDRIYVTGLSMGGYGSWHLAQDHPELFAAIAPVCGGGVPWNAATLTMPVWTCHGSADNVVDVTETEKMVAAMQSCGGDVTYVRLEGVEHNAWDYTYDAAMMEWLLSHKRQRR